MRSEEIGHHLEEDKNILFLERTFFLGLSLEEISVLRSEEISLTPRQEFILGWCEGWDGFDVCSFL